jgi:hypothetical protein
MKNTAWEMISMDLGAGFTMLLPQEIIIWEYYYSGWLNHHPGNYSTIKQFSR